MVWGHDILPGLFFLRLCVDFYVVSHGRSSLWNCVESYEIFFLFRWTISYFTVVCIAMLACVSLLRSNGSTFVRDSYQTQLRSGMREIQFSGRFQCKIGLISSDVHPLSHTCSRLYSCFFVLCVQNRLTSNKSMSKRRRKNFPLPPSCCCYMCCVHDNRSSNL